MIDSHLHIWDPRKFNYPWLADVPTIGRSFSLDDYGCAIDKYDIDKMIFVQCECKPEQFRQEVDWVTAQAKTDERLCGIVSYLPAERGKGVIADLEWLSTNPLVKGVRRMYDSEPEICFSLPFLRAVNLLPKYEFSFDISCKPNALPATIKMIRQCPDTSFILDHLGKPDVYNNRLDEFKRNMEELAAFPNVTAKLSGLATEALPGKWNSDTLKPFIDCALECFGENRLMFGSDWPVILLAGTFASWCDTLNYILADQSQEVRGKIFSYNAEYIYNLNT